VGGAQLTTHHLALALAGRGHEVSVLAQAALPDSWPRTGPPPAGYPVIEAERPDELLGSLPHDLLVVGGYGASSRTWTERMLAASAGASTALYLHDVANADLRAERMLAVSEFVAAASGAEVLPPIVERERYRVDTSRRAVLFVSAVQQKGLEVALALAAARPDVPFVFQHCSRVHLRDPNPLERAAAGLPNVTLRDPVTSPQELYRDARMVLAPSVYPEGFGRVVAEAQASGIPALVSDAGGLPEAAGDAAVLVPASAALGHWLAGLARLWDDPATYASYAARADASARSGRLSPAVVAKRFEALVATALPSSSPT
jgi:glycosyltransferase involved in cell wall biosynthesis